MITFSNERYISAHGKNPRGEGQWMFLLGSARTGHAGSYRPIFWYGSLSDAKRAVRKRARELGFEGTIYVMP